MTGYKSKARQLRGDRDRSGSRALLLRHRLHAFLRDLPRQGLEIDLLETHIPIVIAYVDLVNHDSQMN
ncbi:MAG: hypothetical protein AMXMBFR7_15950 [Planctomycetota bacterium]